MIPRVVYVNGRYVPYGVARVHVEDRGYLFADGVYEVCAIRGGRLLDVAAHIARLVRSLSALRIPMPMTEAALMLVMEQVRRRNGINHGLIYLQVTRGVAERDHVFPDEPLKPALVILARPVDVERQDARASSGIAVHTMADNRWTRRDIKTIGLLGNVLGKQAAKEAGASEVWFFDQDGLVTEGGSTNAWIVDAHGQLRTRPLSHSILAGVTRGELLELLNGLGLTLVETPFTVLEAQQAREAFSTSAVALVVPVIRIDGAPIGDGRPGQIAKRLRQTYLRRAEA